jgi:spore coat polysaccharide biosynthesis predicted glycosyltransferase SpsG
MTKGTPPRVLFRVAAGPRLGFGHLVRARALARALGIRRPRVALRGPALVERTASRLGFAIVRGTASDLLRRIAPDVLVIDDPSAVAARRWRRPAAALGVPVASVHDGGRAYCGADVSIDGSLVDRRAAGWPADGSILADTRYAILDPRIASARGARRRSASVLIALGGGPRVAVARKLARAIRRRRPDVDLAAAAARPGARTVALRRRDRRRRSLAL